VDLELTLVEGLVTRTVRLPAVLLADDGTGLAIAG